MQDLHKTLAQSSTFVMIKGTLESFTGSLSDLSLTRLPLNDKLIDAKYQIISVLGEGGMGTVYRAHHLALDKDVALKTFRSPDLSPSSWERFQREAKAIARLENKNIVRVFDFGFVDGNRPYYTMELLEGESLSERLARLKTLPLEDTIDIFVAVAEGLVNAHAKRIVHRDLKPGNIFLELKNDRVIGIKLVDFGIAKLVGDSDVQEQTLTGCLIFGSPLYMSPEQARGEAIDERSDIYSYACALYETLTGRPPFVGANSLATISSHLSDPPPKLARYAPDADYPAWLDVLIANMLAKRKEDRISSFQEVLDVIFYNSNDTANNSSRSSSPDGDFLQSSVRQTLIERLDKRTLITLALAVSFIAVAAAVIILKPVQYVQRLNATHQAELAEKQRFYKGIEHTPEGDFKIFDFGAESIGLIAAVNKEGYKLGDQIPCIHRVLVPDRSLVFEPGQMVSDHPELLARFSPGDLYGVFMLTKFSWTNQHIRALAHLKDLRALGFTSSKINNAVLDVIGGFAKLTTLDVNKSELNGSDLCKLANVRGLDRIVVNNLAGIGPFITFVIEEKIVLRDLAAKDCQLDDHDAQNIAKLRGLEILSLDGNPITARGVKSLCALPILKHLSITNCDFGPEALEDLASIKSLQSLELAQSQVGKDGTQKFHSLNPHCAFHIKIPKDFMPTEPVKY